MPITTQVWTPDDYLNAADMNRIESNILTLVTYIRSFTYFIPVISGLTSRTTTSIDWVSTINRIEQNLDTIRAYFVTPPDYLPMEVWTVGKPLDYIALNRLEMNTQLLYDYGPLVYSSFKWCGQTTCGGGGLY